MSDADLARLSTGFTTFTDSRGIEWTPIRWTVDRSGVIYWGVRKPGDGSQDHEAGSSIGLTQALHSVASIAVRYLAEIVGAA